MPLLPVALLLGAGIVAGRYAPLRLGVWAAVGLSAWAVGVGALSRRHLRTLSAGSLAVALAIMSVGALRFFSKNENVT